MTIQQQSKRSPSRGHRLAFQDLACLDLACQGLRFAEPMVHGYFQVLPTAATWTSSKQFNSSVLGSDSGKRVAT